MQFDKTMASSTFSLFADMVQQIADRGRALIGRARGDAGTPDTLMITASDLLSGVGEASGIARATDLLESYAAATTEVKREFLSVLARDFGSNQDRLSVAIEAYRAAPNPTTALTVHHAAEPRRQELFRRLNRAPGGTIALVRMREDVLAAMAEDSALKDVDSDFAHLFGSWFNRGFLMLRQVDWSSSARLLDKIIEYEAVHPIKDFESLRQRLAPSDRRLFAFFHPAMTDEPLIFVEVALMDEVPATIRLVLNPDRSPIQAANATTAVFYSISSCQKGLAGISFGNFLIKQVVEDLRRELPSLRTFVTLSPVPGFMKWLRRETSDHKSKVLTPEEKSLLSDALHSGWPETSDPHADGGLQIQSLVATYLLFGKTAAGKPLDQVARFHLGNGARLERIHVNANLSKKGLSEAAGVMVNYLYDINSIERNHEAFAERGEIVVSREVRRIARSNRSAPSIATN